MRNSKSNRSAKSQNSRFKKPSRKQYPPKSRKAVARGTKFKSSTTSKKSSVKAMSPSAPKPATLAKPLKGEVRKAAGGARSKTIDKRQAQVEKGRAVRKLFEQGHSREELAMKFRCSESLIRKLIILGRLPRDLKMAYLQKKLNRKEVLEKARARKNIDKPTVPVASEIPSEGTRQNSLPRPVAVIKGARIQQNPSSLMTEAVRQGKISKYVQIIVEWLPQTGVRPCDYRTFFKQVMSVLDGTRPWLFSEEAPEPHEINPDEDPWEVITRCKPKGGSLQTAPDVANNPVTWLARWIQQVIPDRGIVKGAISKAKIQLLDQVR